MKVKTVFILLFVASVPFFPGGGIWAETVKVRKMHNLDEETNFNNMTDTVATLGKSADDKKRIKMERHSQRRQARLDKEEKRRQARIQKKMKQQNKIIENKIKAIEKAKKKNR